MYRTQFAITFIPTNSSEWLQNYGFFFFWGGGAVLGNLKRINYHVCVYNLCLCAISLYVCVGVNLLFTLEVKSLGHKSHRS